MIYLLIFLIHSQIATLILLVYVHKSWKIETKFIKDMVNLREESNGRRILFEERD